MKTKRCTKCKEEKTLEEYYKDATHRDGRRSECKNCAQEYKKSEKGKLTKAKADVKYSKTNKGKLAHAKAQVKYRKTNKSKLAETRYRKSEKGKLTAAKYWKTTKGKALAARKGHNRRINIANTKNTLTDKEFDFIVFDCQNNKCIGPDHEGSKYFTDKVKPQRDHINPVSKGGNFTVYTVQALCRSCDSKKGARYIDYRSDYHREMIKTI